ncbi:Subunit R is required for both nuclease and ATPase activities [Vibrio sp. B1FIG11]|uniref:type I restriction endonuclease subunit R n=1 Tax=Vibrio sp. B1FIG11 TaxID=2751177 RepID=UPI001AF6E750|nr:type I restriction endonuclease subunit R [Vibrio sp. B1FIG11]CAD7797499.1 Subunit R is required for both nuclease and ATPase activities [Vibrio sp. B1FIG11]CAD7800812.1 Subunit R is required for both nuclease and ATPase activities [Vibrio sp. B1FIG11]CAD7801822.1 Subunit R is required for both nuclease and ATPase activities [Vibrio sp. B1FIG11]CAD7803171.1 Subunit R is required for both nuclease and ATPase activities [Vibrio sp. B1FIG11]CAE6880037.1 Subunit R is required for both nuclease 
MAYQSEQQLEDNLIAQLGTQGFEVIAPRDNTALEANLKAQLEKVNECTLSDTEFRQVLGKLEKGNIFTKAKTLRDQLDVTLDNGDSRHLTLLFDEASKNKFQVAQQITVKGIYTNRYDVTVLVNGLPLVQIELKRRGIELKEAFNQVKRYQKHSYHANHGLFNYVQLFVISNGVNTQYFSNNSEMSAKQTFDWTDFDNKKISQLPSFASAFLTTPHLTAMLTKYIVLNETGKFLMVLRPYQFYAVEEIIKQVRTTDLNGYIWHTTGSGKTLTSFKAAQIMTSLSEVDKVVFVVDRKDLDYQTALEFNAFAKGCVDSTDNTNMLFHQLIDKPIKGKKINENRNNKLVVTTLQKLNNVVTKKRYLSEMEALRDKRIIFIFDECHRSQFGDTHQNITQFFQGAQLFGFTGTPIFAKNAVAKKSIKKTTKDLFGECLHPYVIVDAIRDNNVLKFAIEYVGRYQYKDGSNNNLDIEVEDIDTKELLSSPARLDKITDYIIAHHRRKTHSRDYNAMFCVSGVPELIQYYELLAKKKAEGKHNLKVATIFSYEANEEEEYELGNGDAVEIQEVAAKYLNDGDAVKLHSRDKLESFIGDYNKMFGTNYTTKDSESFYNYYKNISKRVKAKEIDILLVVNMFLTGFDAPRLNTLYVDKSLKHHGLIQAFSRTNRLLDETKSHGNVVCFRNLKTAADDAFKMFSNKQPTEVIEMPSYDDLMADFDKAYAALISITPTVDSVDSLPDEEAQAWFVRQFRELMRLKNMLGNFADFDMDATEMSEQEFQDFTSKYADLNRQLRENSTKEKVSILDDVDFELELMHRDEVNVGYILHLLRELHEEESTEEKARKRQVIANLIGSDPTLLSKKALIEKFMNDHLEGIPAHADVEEEFEFFWEKEKRKALESMANEENLDTEKLEILVNRYELSEEMPLRDDFAGTLQTKPTILQRKKIVGRLAEKFKGFVDTFIGGF